MPLLQTTTDDPLFLKAIGAREQEALWQTLGEHPSDQALLNTLLRVWKNRTFRGCILDVGTFEGAAGVRPRLVLQVDFESPVELEGEALAKRLRAALGFGAAAEDPNGDARATLTVNGEHYEAKAYLQAASDHDPLLRLLIYTETHEHRLSLVFQDRAPQPLRIVKAQEGRDSLEAPERFRENQAYGLHIISPPATFPFRYLLRSGVLTRTDRRSGHFEIAASLKAKASGAPKHLTLSGEYIANVSHR